MAAVPWLKTASYPRKNDWRLDHTSFVSRSVVLVVAALQAAGCGSSRRDVVYETTLEQDRIVTLDFRAGEVSALLSVLGVTRCAASWNDESDVPFRAPCWSMTPVENCDFTCASRAQHLSRSL